MHQYLAELVLLNKGTTEQFLGSSFMCVLQLKRQIRSNPYSSKNLQTNLSSDDFKTSKVPALRVYILNLVPAEYTDFHISAYYSTLSFEI